MTLWHVQAFPSVSDPKSALLRDCWVLYKRVWLLNVLFVIWSDLGGVIIEQDSKTAGGEVGEQNWADTKELTTTVAVLSMRIHWSLKGNTKWVEARMAGIHRCTKLVKEELVNHFSTAHVFSILLSKQAVRCTYKFQGLTVMNSNNRIT